MATLTTLNDTITSEASPGTYYPARPTLTARNVTSKRLYSWVKISGLPSRPGAVVTSAVLRLFPVEDFASVTFNLKLPTAAWTSSKLKWSNQPSVGSTVATVAAAGVKEQPFDIDITSTVQAWVSGGEPNRGVRIETTSTAADGRSFYSMNAAGTKAMFRPVLLVEVSYAPEKPIDIVPSGGAKVSVSDPVISWRYAGDGVAPMKAYQVLTFAEGGTPTPSMSERVASFNVNGIASGAPSFPSRVAGIAATIISSGASIVLAQEANSTSSPDQPAALIAALASAGSTGWQAFIGPNLNVIFVKTSVFAPQATKTKDLALGTGKYASALPVKHIASGLTFTAVSTHYLAGDAYAAERVAATELLIPWLNSFGPVVVGGDLNTASNAVGKPLAMLAQAGYLETRTLVDAVTNGNLDSISNYGEPNPGNGSWVDHVLVRGGLGPSVVGLVDSGEYSDHNLVYSEIGYAAVSTDVGEPSGDTGWIDSTTPQHQLSGVAGDVSFVIRHKSTDGRESPYSDVQTVGYAAKGALTITSTETTTDDPSPTTTWDFDGDQTAFRVYYIDADTGAVIADSGQQSGDENQWSPEKPLNVTSTTNILRLVHVWDDVGRVTTPGDPAYVEATNGPFTIEPGAIAPATGLTISTPLGPVVELTWSRATPDLWIIERRIDGGEWVKFTAEAGDVAVGASTHVWRDVTAPAEHDLEYRVSPVVNGSMGLATASEVTRIKSQFIWLADTDDTDWLLPVAGNDSGSWALGEDSSVVNVLGSDRSVLIHEGFRGYEGSISGRFVSEVPQMGGTTAQQQRDLAWRLKEQPTKVWRLVLGDMNIPVVVRNVTPVPQPGAEVTFGFAFDFYQQGSLAWETA